MNKRLKNFRNLLVDFKPDRECGNDLLRVDHLTKTIGDRKVLDDVSFVIHPREKVAFVGSDVVAKTTLFKIIMGELEPDEGSFKWGITTKTAYLQRKLPVSRLYALPAVLLFLPGCFTPKCQLAQNSARKFGRRFC